VRSYSQISGDGGSRVAEQIADLEAAIARRLGLVRHRVAIGSGKGGVGKSTLTRQLAAVLAATGRRVGILDADLNGPSQALLGGLGATPPLPGPEGLIVPRSRDGVRILSAGSLIAEGAALAFPEGGAGHAHVWRATREFASFAHLLATAEWGSLDVLFVDLPPGPERTAQFADFLGPATDMVLVTVPSALARGVVSRSVDALRALPNRQLGYIENMSGYACASCGTVRALFPEEPESRPLGLDCLGRIPFDPELARLSDRGMALTQAAREGEPERPALAALRALAGEIDRRLEKER
jgi:ATP-binding protein involved in chromosome partitioning